MLLLEIDEAYCHNVYEEYKTLCSQSALYVQHGRGSHQSQPIDVSSLERKKALAIELIQVCKLLPKLEAVIWFSNRAGYEVVDQGRIEVSNPSIHSTSLRC